ncbi:hypothetical protein TP49_22860 (plasmid) [Xanthomonas citri pv. aurantifolii]|nr:hypothetical protein TP49_22860 [Xanthomonas citri pv. aurantifolii]
MAGDGDVWCFAVLTDFLSIYQRMSGQLNCFRGLAVVPCCDHAAIGVDTILLELTLSLGAAMGDNDLVGIDPSVNNSLIARRTIYVLKALV